MVMQRSHTKAVRFRQWRIQEFFRWVSVEDRGQGERVSGGGNPLIRGSGGSCNLVQENLISYSKIFLIFGTVKLFMMATNLFVIANVKQT